MEFNLRQRVQHAPQRVFALLADPRQRPRWQASLSAVEMIDGGEPRLGMRWRERPYGLSQVALEISAFEPDRLWAEQFESRVASGSMSVRFAPAGAGATDLDLHATVTLRGPLALATGVAKRLLQREIRRDLARIEQVLSS
jgi:uncharacterized protein YndB with AHSA1/START domain